MDQGLLIRELDKLLRADADMKRYHAVREQQAVARALGTNRKSIDGLGQPTMELTPEVYHHWGQRLGYQCWKDKQFLREFKRDNPEVRVKATGTKAQVGYSRSGQILSPALRGSGAVERAVRFRKVYSL